MSKTSASTAKRKLTRSEQREIEKIIRTARGDGKPHSAQDSIPFDVMYPDGLCKLDEKSWSKCIEFEDVNYQLANTDEKTAVFENLCDFYNYYDTSIGIQLSLISRYTNKEDFQKIIAIPPQGDDFDGIRDEYTGMPQTQLERGNNGLIKTKFLTLTIEADNIQAARSRLPLTESVPSGMYWDATQRTWENQYMARLIVNDKPILLVPKRVEWKFWCCTE